MRKTKIVATLGPATHDPDTIADLVDAGVDVFRQNFSHGDHADHADLYDMAREASDDVAVMMDTKGPELRLGEVEPGTDLEQGSTVTVVAGEDGGDASTLPVPNAAALDRIEPGDRILIDDGRIEMDVEEAGDGLSCTVLYGGPVTSRDSISVPGRDLGLEFPTDEDEDDIGFAAEQGFDFIAVSFVRSADDVAAVRDILGDDSDIHIVAKMEHVQAIENMDEIIAASDGIMVARGDLGVELPAAQVPTHQKRIIRKCNEAGKPVITATEMLTSMVDSRRATRAEVSDVANAVLDGSDAVMLSEETAVGNYPVTTVAFMDEVLRDVEESWSPHLSHIEGTDGDVSETICRNIYEASKHLDLAYLVAHTQSGFTARNIAKYRPETPIVAFTNSSRVRRQLQLAWGVQAFELDFPDYVDELVAASATFLHEQGMVDMDDTAIFSAGTPTSEAGTTNMMEIRDIDSIIG